MKVKDAWEAMVETAGQVKAFGKDWRARRRAKKMEAKTDPMEIDRRSQEQVEKEALQARINFLQEESLKWQEEINKLQNEIARIKKREEEEQAVWSERVFSIKQFLAEWKLGVTTQQELHDKFLALKTSLSSSLPTEVP